MSITDSQTDATEEVFFESIKEPRDNYFVEYLPPRPGFRFATLSLAFFKSVAPTSVSPLMEEELRHWVARYRVPIMVSAFDETDSLISLENLHSGNHLVGWYAPHTNQIISSWKHSDLDSFLKENPFSIDLRTIYVDVPYRTKRQIKDSADKKIREWQRQTLTLKILLIFWLAVVPAGVALVEYFGPEWLSLVVLIYSLWQAWVAWRKISGRRKPSIEEKEKADKELKMRHYYYHCERNPTGFERLKVENFAEDARLSISREAAELANLLKTKSQHD